MYCPNCKQEHAGAFCPECGTKLIEKPVASSASGIGLNMGDANAISGGVHMSDSHNVDHSVHNIDNSVHNVTTNNTTVNNNYTTVHEREKSAEELLQEVEAEFITAIEELCKGGHIDQAGYAELSILAQKKNIDPNRAGQLIDSVRRNVTQKSGGASNDFLAEKTLKEIKTAVAVCNTEVLRQKLPALKQLAKNSTDNEVQFFYHLLYATFNPESCTIEFVNSHVDNYWQTYWTSIAYIKRGRNEQANELLPRLGAFGFPKGDMSLLLAISSVADWRKHPMQSFYMQQAKENMEEANHYGISEQLTPLWLAVNQLLSDAPSVEDMFRFYYSNTLRELCVSVAPAMPKEAQKAVVPPPMPPQMPPQMPAMPQEKKETTQKNTPQRQGNALDRLNKAVMQSQMQMTTMQMPTMQMPQMTTMQMPQMQTPTMQMPQMDMKQMSSMQDMQAQMGGMPQMAGMATPPPMPQMAGMATPPPVPQMAGMATPPPMPQMAGMATPPPMPQMPKAPSASQPSCKQEELVVPGPSDLPTERVPQYGILFTDSLVLADKYGCDVQTVYDVLNEFVQTSAKAEQHWYLLDAANYRQQLGRDPYWGDYNEILSQYIYDNGFQVGVGTPVFIIGGADVIPVPKLENPMHGGMIPTDMGYCFSTTFFSDLWDGDHHISNDYVRNTASRLPLEVGKMQTTIHDDLQSYFNLCASASEGIEVEGVVMASNVDWIDNSIAMAHHLPLIYTNTDDEGEIYKRMYVCPKLVTADTEGSNVDPKVLAHYQEALQHAGILLFNLHGSGCKGVSGFYCNNDMGRNPESFNIELMRQSNARVLNTVACFGARYDEYDRDDSMLMASLLGGGKLLYAGSTISVPMIGGLRYPEGVTQYPGSGSEKFMPLYCYYQFCGLPAGQAMMQAKLDYFNTFRHFERDDFSLSTAMMFGLYGNPMLHVKARQDVMDNAVRYEVLPQVPQTKAADAPIRMKRMKCVLSKEQLHSSKSLIEDLRGCVDNNLQAIHDVLKQNLYQQLGLDPRWLDQVDEFEMVDESGQELSGYLYNYDDDNNYGRKTLIEVDKQGNITRQITFK